MKILLVKETRHRETRVALIPRDVKSLVALGHQIVVESGAGVAAGFNDAAYIAAGAQIRQPISIDAHQLFRGIDLIVRVKRASQARERLELENFRSGLKMVGALDPRESGSTHVDDYIRHHVKAYSLDQLALDTDDPMNILAAMGQMTGQLAFADAIKRSLLEVQNLMIIGLGVVGRSILHEAHKQGLHINAAVTSKESAIECQAQGVSAILLDKNVALDEQRNALRPHLKQVDIVFACARSPGMQAPLLITHEMMLSMKPQALLIDLALSEGGNVEGAVHDKTLKVNDNPIFVSNISAYPKAKPQQASELWSRAIRCFINKLACGDPQVEACVLPISNKNQ